MKMRIASFVVMISLSVGGALAYAHVPSSREAVKRKFEDQLFAGKYFRNATCKAFANFILEKNGLPPLDKAAGVNGLRQDVDRRGEDKNPPEFTDGLAREHAQPDSFKISASGDRTTWNLTLDRKQPNQHFKTRTEFHFAILEKGNEGSCELKNLSFNASEDGTKHKFSKTMNLDSCVGLFLQGPPNPKTTPALASAAIHYLRDDCSVGMRYSSEAKSIHQR